MSYYRSKLLPLPGYLLFFVMLFVPTTYQTIKAGLLILVLGMIIVPSLLINRLALHSTVFLWTLFMACVGLAFMLVGVFHNAPGALRVGTVYVLWPLVYTVLVAGAAKETILDGLLATLVVAGIAIGAYSINYVLYAAGWLPEIMYFPIDQGQDIGFYGGYTEIRLYSLSSLLFLVPFCIAGLIIWWNELDLPIRRFWLWMALALGIIVVLLSGRRALLLIVAIAPVITLLLRFFLPTNIRKQNHKLINKFFIKAGFMLIPIGIYLNMAFGLDLTALDEMFRRGFQFFDDVSALARHEQLLVLFKEWSYAPILGAGHGASASGLIRSESMPWAYELYYVSLLFQTGLLGFLCYTVAVLWIYFMSFKVMRSGQRIGVLLLPVMVGMTCFLIANFTNPYLGKFDYIWVIFLPVAFINHWLLYKQ